MIKFKLCKIWVELQQIVDNLFFCVVIILMGFFVEDAVED